MLGGGDGGDTAIVSRTFGGIETSSSKVVILMSSIVGIVVGDELREWGDWFFRSRAFFPSLPRCAPLRSSDSGVVVMSQNCSGRAWNVV